jgi:hypothetical protein
VEREVSEFKHCLADRNPKTMRKQLFGDDASKTLHPRAPPNANRRRRRLAAQPATSDADARRQLNTSRSSEGSGGNGPGLLHADPARLALCKEREDLNRHAAINKCYSGRVVLSVYAAFLVEWLAHFEGRQLLALPLEGLDQTPRAWLGGVYAFLGLRPPREVGLAFCLTPPPFLGRNLFAVLFARSRSDVCICFDFFFQTLRLTLRFVIYCFRLTCPLS